MSIMESLPKFSDLKRFRRHIAHASMLNLISFIIPIACGILWNAQENGVVDPLTYFVGWSMDTLADNLQKAKREYGAESVAFWVAYTKEPRPYFHRLTHAFGSPNYCTESSSCATSAMLATYLTYGTHHVPNQNHRLIAASSGVPV